MFDYILSASAKEDLKRIYAYGLAEFGEQQADKYFYDFFDMFQKRPSYGFNPPLIG